MKATATTASKAELNFVSRSILKRDTLRGLDRNKSKGEAIRLIATCLEEWGFYLNMVSGDTILGDKGQRSLAFSRDDNEGRMIENARIQFVWEKLDDERMEFLAYVS
jgi:hypothetical protein